MKNNSLLQDFINFSKYDKIFQNWRIRESVSIAQVLY